MRCGAGSGTSGKQRVRYADGDVESIDLAPRPRDSPGPLFSYHVDAALHNESWRTSVCNYFGLSRLPPPAVAAAVAFDPVSFKKTKHVLRAAEFLRDLHVVARKVVRLEHVAGCVAPSELVSFCHAHSDLLRPLGGRADRDSGPCA